MRNLKKILALVLALVMSLSLMATAGAKDFADKSDIEATGYQTAVDVLAELEVIRGYENGSFQPNGDITRAEVAAIIYRIATKDVKDTQASIYTSWNKFSDVQNGAWFAGYVNYCANAQIVKGTSATTFEPENKVTGYQVLAMILRTMGYGKNGEFEGANWAINTAAKAKEIGILENVVNEELGSPASRALVAEILFRALLTDTVDYNVLTGYQPNGKTLGQTQFGMEEITGVVMANQYADLEDVEPLSEDKTRLNVDGKNYVLNVATDLTDIGESRAAYVRKSAQNSFDLLVDELYDTGLNAVAETGAAQSSVASFAAKSEAGLDIKDAQHFVNFDYEIAGVSEWRIEYQVEFDNSKNSDDQTAYEYFTQDVLGFDLWDVFHKEDGTLKNPRLDKVADEESYTRVIPMGEPITNEDIAIMKGIFSVASDDNQNQWKVGVTGYVYAGTSKKADEHDLSSEMTWRAFKAEYIDSKADTNVKSTVNGDWLKIIDNDGDGVAEYVFKTVYCMEEVLGWNSRNQYFTFGYYDENDKLHSHIGRDYNVIDGSELEVGDVVLVAEIDGVWQVEKAPEEIKVIQTVNYRKDTVTTTEGDEYVQSGIDLDHNMNWDIMAMDEKVEYTIYFDHFGYVGAYETEAAETSYALLDELYGRTDQNHQWITKEIVRVEITMGEEKTAEKIVSNWGKGELKDNAPYFAGTWNDWNNELQTAINHLGTDRVLREVDVPDHGTEFRYPTDTGKTAQTNVAIYTYDEEDDTVAIYPAAEFAKNRAGERLYYAGHGYGVDANKRVTEAEFADLYNAVPGNGKYADLSSIAQWSLLKPVYARDYVKLDTSKDIGSNQRHYEMDEADASWNQYGLQGDGYVGNYVNATSNTEYYVVIGTGATYYKGFENLPKFKADQISAMYAVARNTTFAQDGTDYWVADVIVIEATGVAKTYDSVALPFFNKSQVSGDKTVKHFDALDNMTQNPYIDLTTKKGWSDQWAAYGFYTLTDTEGTEPDITASIDKITSNWNVYKIYAGTVYRVHGLENYIDVIDGDGNHIAVDDDNLDDVPVYGIVDYNKSEKWQLYDEDGYSWTEYLKTGDQIIYVYNKSGSALKFIVVANFDATRLDPKSKARCCTWIGGLWQDIIDSQKAEIPVTYPVTLEFNLGVDEELTIICEGVKYPHMGDTDPLTADEVEIRVPDTDEFVFTVNRLQVFALKANPDYEFHYWENADDPDMVDVRASKVSVVKPLSGEADATPPVIGTAYTVDAVNTIVEMAKMGVGAEDGMISVEDANTLFTKLFEINQGKISEDATINGTPVEEVVAANAKTVLMNVIVAENPDLAADVARAMIEEAVAAAIDAAVKSEAAEPVTIEDVKADESVSETVGTLEEAIEAGIDLSELPKDTSLDDLKDQVSEAQEAKKVNVTLTASDVEITDVIAKDGKVTAKNGDYTIEADTEVMVVLTVTSETEIVLGTKVVLTSADADAVKIEAVEVAADDLSGDRKTAAVSVKIPAGATGTYTVKLVPPTT